MLLLIDPATIKSFQVVHPVMGVANALDPSQYITFKSYKLTGSLYQEPNYTFQVRVGKRLLTLIIDVFSQNMTKPCI